MQDICAQNPVLAGQRVDHHLGRRRAIGKVEKRSPTPRDAVPLDLGGGVEPVRRQADPRLIGLGDQIGETPDLRPSPHLARRENHRLGRAARPRGGKLRQPRPDRQAGVLNRHPVQIRARRGGRGRGIGHFRGIGRAHPHRFGRDRKDLRGHLRELLMQALPHLGAAMVHQHRAIGIKLHQGPRLVQMRQRKGNAEFHRAQRDPALERPVRRVPFRHRRLARLVVRIGLQLRHKRVQHAILDGLAVMGLLRLHFARNIPGRRGFASAGQSPLGGRGIEIAFAQVERVEPCDMGQMVHRALHPQQALRPAKAAKGGGALGVGAQPVAFDPHRGHEIAAVRMQHRPVADRQAQVP